MFKSDRLKTVLLALTIAGSALAQSAGRAEVGLTAPAPTGPLTAASANLEERSVSPSDQHGYTDRFLNDRLSYWCKHLKLEEWQVSVVMVRRDALRAKTLGKIQWDKKKKTAVIEVMDPSDYRLSFRPMLDDMEFTVVHELVHLSLASLPRSEASRSSEEHAVNRLAEALVRLDSRPKD
jgi:hypothetical protein